jgi:integrase
MAKDLTEAALKSLKAGTARREIPDGHTRGLYLILQPSGAASWAVRYRDLAGKGTKLTLGSYPAIRIPDARKLASEALTKVARGENPAAAKRQAREAARAAVRSENDLVENVVAKFIERHAKPKTRDWRETERLLVKNVIPIWKGRRLGEIGRVDVHTLLESIVDRGAPVSANRVFTQLRRMCRFAVERGIIDRNPCEGLSLPSVEKPRDRVLNDDELALVWMAAERLDYPFGPIVHLLILTGQRKSEIAEGRWSEVDLDAALWSLPASRVKNKRPHAVPLSPHATAIVHTLPRIDDSDLLFTTTGKTAVSGFSRVKESLDKAIAELNGGEPIAPWTYHDLRRSCASGLARIGVDLVVIERTLNHVSGSFAGVVEIYQRHKFETEMRDALERWGRHVERLAAGSAEPNNVLELAKARG